MVTATIDRIFKACDYVFINGETVDECWYSEEDQYYVFKSNYNRDWDNCCIPKGTVLTLDAMGETTTQVEYIYSWSHPTSVQIKFGIYQPLTKEILTRKLLNIP